MLREFQNLDGLKTIDFVPNDELPALQFLEQRLDIDGVEREQLGLDALWAVFRPTIAVGQAPAASEAQARPGRASSAQPSGRSN